MRLKERLPISPDKKIEEEIMKKNFFINVTRTMISSFEIKDMSKIKRTPISALKDFTNYNCPIRNVINKTLGFNTDIKTACNITKEESDKIKVFLINGTIETLANAFYSKDTAIPHTTKAWIVEKFTSIKKPNGEQYSIENFREHLEKHFVNFEVKERKPYACQDLNKERIKKSNSRRDDMTLHEINNILRAKEKSLGVDFKPIPW
jgi:hypothetical protein